jgi:hypothetical protein
MKVGKYGDHSPDDTFVPLAVETYGRTRPKLTRRSTGFSALALSRRAAELRASRRLWVSPDGVYADLLLSV